MADLILVRPMAPISASILLACFALCACSQVPSVRFGLINRLGITETHHIPYAVGAHYGFRIDYRDTGHSVTLREQFDLPGPARWHSTSPPEERTGASRSGRTLTREVQLGSNTPAPPDVHSFYIEDIQIAHGDPKGEYRVKLWLDDRPFREFHFYIE